MSTREKTQGRLAYAAANEENETLQRIHQVSQARFVQAMAGLREDLAALRHQLPLRPGSPHQRQCQELILRVEQKILQVEEARVDDLMREAGDADRVQQLISQSRRRMHGDEAE